MPFYSPFAYYARVRMQLESYVPELAHKRSQMEKFLRTSRTWKLTAQPNVLPGSDEEKDRNQAITAFYLHNVPMSRWLNSNQWIVPEVARKGIKCEQLAEHLPTQKISFLDLLCTNFFVAHYSETRNQNHSSTGANEQLLSLISGGKSGSGGSSVQQPKDPYTGLRFDEVWTVPMLDGTKITPSPTPKALAAGLDGILFLSPANQPVLFNTIFYDIYDSYSKWMHEDLVLTVVKKANADVVIYMYQDNNNNKLYASSDVRALSTTVFKRVEHARAVSNFTDGENY